jgi:hypothetical protein
MTEVFKHCKHCGIIFQGPPPSDWRCTQGGTCVWVVTVPQPEVVPAKGDK